jgi:hypothetical protein
MNRMLRAFVLAGGVAALLVPLAALPAAAHGTKKQGDLVMTVGFGTEPALAGAVNRRACWRSSGWWSGSPASASGCSP